MGRQTLGPGPGLGTLWGLQLGAEMRTGLGGWRRVSHGACRTGAPSWNPLSSVPEAREQPLLPGGTPPDGDGGLHSTGAQSSY